MQGHPFAGFDQNYPFEQTNMYFNGNTSSQPYYNNPPYNGNASSQPHYNNPPYNTGPYYSENYNPNTFFPPMNTFTQFEPTTATHLPQSSPQSNTSNAANGINAPQTQPTATPGINLPGTEDMMPVPELPRIFFDPSTVHGNLNMGPMLPTPNHLDAFKMHYRFSKHRVDYWDKYLKDIGISVSS